MNDCFCISEIQTTNNAIYTQAVNFQFRIYKVFSYLFSLANFSSTKFIFAFESFPLKMYIVSSKTKWHNVSYRYISYVKSETSFIWRIGAWFLKPFEERVEENHIYHIVKPNSTVKTKTVYRGCNVCYHFFLENGKIDFNSKI